MLNVFTLWRQIPISSFGIFNTSPQALQCTASGSCRSNAHFGHRKRTLSGTRTARASPKNSVTPKIMMMMEISLPSVPGSVMSPNPVVVSAATVK
jgi:hypothetical protein